MKKLTPPITVWIHGTNLQQLLPGKLSDIQVEPLHKFMYCQPGLHHAQFLDTSFHHHQIGLALHESSPDAFPLETLYLFGWSGKLNATERYKAAQKLHKALKEVIREYEVNYGQKPFIRIISHSHGGNIALNLALIHNQDNILTVDELVLLACPVQKLTAPLIKHPVFQKIYSLHSHWDFPQIADPQGWPSIKEQFKKFFQYGSVEHLKAAFMRTEQEPFFSERHFSHADNIIQAVITCQGRHLAHIQFMMKPFVQKIPQIIMALRSLPSQKSLNPDLEIDINNEPITL